MIEISNITFECFVVIIVIVDSSHKAGGHRADRLYF